MLWSLMSSRSASVLIAASRLSAFRSAQRDGTVSGTSAMTSVMRLRLDSRANSIGNAGPSFCHSPDSRNSPGFQTNDPQPKHAILILSSPKSEDHSDLNRWWSNAFRYCRTFRSVHEGRHPSLLNTSASLDCQSKIIKRPPQNVAQPTNGTWRQETRSGTAEGDCCSSHGSGRAQVQ